MWRAFFLATGVYLVILGAEALAIEQAVLKAREPAPPANTLLDVGKPRLGPHKTITPPDWAPWSLMSTGMIVVLYSFSIPRRINGG
jgi:hypothetical protein